MAYVLRFSFCSEQFPQKHGNSDDSHQIKFNGSTIVGRWMEEILLCEMIRKSYLNRNAPCPFGIARKRERDGVLGSRMLISFGFHHILPNSRLRAPSSFSIQSTMHKMCDHSASKWVFPTNIIFIRMFYNLLFSLWFTMLVRLIADAFFPKFAAKCSQQSCFATAASKQYGAQRREWEENAMKPKPATSSSTGSHMHENGWMFAAQH